uniref:Endoplasmic reticulum transmembrane protein n=1 Tax=Aegilops tauschii TaxID=37682 RepID=M8C9A2_AEGTA
MGLQWMLLTCVVGAEAAVAALLTLPAPRAVRAQIVGLTSMLLQPMAAVLPFAAFQLLDIYWKNEHRLICTGEMCTSEERVRFEKSGFLPFGSIFKSQRNVILCVSVFILYWSIYRICKFNKDIKALEEVEKRIKEE